MIRLLPILAVVVSLFPNAAVRADVKLPAVLDSHMVLQRDMPLKIWGTADPEEAVTVSLGGETASTKAGKNGNWIVTLKAQKADGKPRQITVKGKNTIVLKDVLIGEVWIGSGQSNMEWQLRSTEMAKDAIASAKHPQIRLFHIPKVQKNAPDTDVNADWKACTPENIPRFSAVLYYFGRRLQDELRVPVGLINSSWGGSPIEPWTIKGGESGKMYNGMIAPITNVAVRGTIWYQGETNVLRKNGFAYAGKMKDLITGWRKAFNNDDMAFHFVQIAPWSGRYGKGELPALWEAQAATLKIPHTGMAVTTDLVDNIRDIHPRNKLDVGNRLARWALAKTYGRKGVVYSGPLYKSMKIEGKTIRLSFAHVAKGLKSRDGKSLTEFEIAGADGKFVKANAKIDGKTVVVSADGIESPKHVRFGWHKVANPNLANAAGLPASPFRTKGWRGGTGE